MSAGLQFLELALVMAVTAHAWACVSSPKTDGAEPPHRVRLVPWIEVNRAGGVELDRAVAGQDPADLAKAVRTFMRKDQEG